MENQIFRLSSPFKHHRMNESGTRPSNLEYSNRMFLQDDEAQDQHGLFSMEELQPAANFVNPVYETMFLVSSLFFSNPVFIFYFNSFN